MWSIKFPQKSTNATIKKSDPCRKLYIEILKENKKSIVLGTPWWEHREDSIKNNFFNFLDNRESAARNGKDSYSHWNSRKTEIFWLRPWWKNEAYSYGQTWSWMPKKKLEKRGFFGILKFRTIKILMPGIFEWFFCSYFLQRFQVFGGHQDEGYQAGGYRELEVWISR